MRHLLAGFLGFLLSGVWFGMQLWLTHTFLKKGRNRLTFFHHGDHILLMDYNTCGFLINLNGIRSHVNSIYFFGHRYVSFPNLYESPAPAADIIFIVSAMLRAVSFLSFLISLSTAHHQKITDSLSVCGLYIIPCSRKLVKQRSPMMIWSVSGIPSSSPASGANLLLHMDVFTS